MNGETKIKIENKIILLFLKKYYEKKSISSFSLMYGVFSNICLYKPNFSRSKELSIRMIYRFR
jgi:hypothetical protein